MADAPKLVDMSYTKAELKEEKKEMSVGYDGSPNPYPWGLGIRLEKKELDKLGIKQLPEVGTEVHFMAVAKVTSVEQSAREGSDERSCIGLQITMMAPLLIESASEEKAEGSDTPAKEAAETKSLASKYRG